MMQEVAELEEKLVEICNQYERRLPLGLLLAALEVVKLRYYQEAINRVRENSE